MEVTTFPDFQQLPSDIRKNYLLTFLPLPELLNLSCTSREYYNLISQNKLWLPEFEKFQARLSLKDWNLSYILSLKISIQTQYYLTDLLTNYLDISGSYYKGYLARCFSKLPLKSLKKFSNIYPIQDIEVDYPTLAINITYDIVRDGESNVTFSFDEDGKLTDFEILIYYDPTADYRHLVRFTFARDNAMTFDSLVPLLRKHFPILQKLDFINEFEVSRDKIQLICDAFLIQTGCSVENYFDLD